MSRVQASFHATNGKRQESECGKDWDLLCENPTAVASYCTGARKLLRIVCTVPCLHPATTVLGLGHECRNSINRTLSQRRNTYDIYRYVLCTMIHLLCVETVTPRVMNGEWRLATDSTVHCSASIFFSAHTSRY